jgi:protease IV
MAINADTLLDRLNLKAQANKWRLFAVLFAVLALIAISERQSIYSPIETPFIARVSFDGIIEDDRLIYDMLDELAENPKAKAIIVWLDTPGGSAVGGEEIFNRLRQISERKPIVAVMRSVSASAGYMVSLGADYVIAREGTITGSIGALIETAEFTGLAEKIGVKPIIVKSGPLKATPNPLEKATPESIRVVQEVIDDFHLKFVDMVSDRRKLPKPVVMELADGRVFSGKRAYENKLIDALGGEDEALAWLTDKRQVSRNLEIKDVQPEQEIDFFTRVSQSFAGYFLQNNRMSLDGVRAIWHPAL